MPSEKHSKNIERIRHSLAHLLAAAVLKKFPTAQLGIGPVIENGFYYDFLLPRPVAQEDLKELEKTMRELVRAKLPFSREKLDSAAAKKLFQNQHFKLDLIKEFAKEDKELTAYHTHSGANVPLGSPVACRMSHVTCFTDLCRGGHVKNTSEIAPDSFTLDTVAGAYWRGDEKNAQLQRIYGIAFDTKKELDAYLARREEARRRDHKKLGVELDLFTFSELVGSGLPLWTPKGTVLRTTLDEFVWELRKNRGYQKVEIPHITKKDLYERSGHWGKFKDELFKITTREGHLFAMKPMNCPHHTQIYARKKWSYRELPQRYANTTMVYRDEQSGELAGLSRVRSITQDDAHVFCRASHVTEECLAIWDIITEFYRAAGFSLRVRLSLHDPAHPEKYLGTPKVWRASENMLRAVARKKKVKFTEAKGEAAFYGPKLDFLAEDSLGREWQLATIQLDMNLPERFNLTCVNEKGKDERIVMIHAAIMGSIERYLSILIEHFGGAFPLWLAPVQAAILPIGAEQKKYAQKLFDVLIKEGIRTELHDANETLGKRIRAAELQKIPYVLVVGEKEEREKTVNVRRHGTASIKATVDKPSFAKAMEGKQEVLKLIEKMRHEIKARAL